MLKINQSNIAINPIWRHEWVTITIPANQKPSRINFPDIQNLRNVHLCTIITFSNEEIPQNLGGTATVKAAIIQSTWLTLQKYNGEEFVHQAPLSRFWSWFASFSNFQAPADFIGQKVNWPKSYIELEALGVEAVDRNFLFSIYYMSDAQLELQSAKYEFKENMQ